MKWVFPKWTVWRYLLSLALCMPPAFILMSFVPPIVAGLISGVVITLLFIIVMGFLDARKENS